jgi:hypothetical protein
MDFQDEENREETAPVQEWARSDQIQMPPPSANVSLRALAWVTVAPAGMLLVSHTLPPMVAPLPMVTLPRMVAPE